MIARILCSFIYSVLYFHSISDAGSQSGHEVPSRNGQTRVCQVAEPVRFLQNISPTSTARSIVRVEEQYMFIILWPNLTISNNFREAFRSGDNVQPRFEGNVLFWTKQRRKKGFHGKDSLI